MLQVKKFGKVYAKFLMQNVIAVLFTIFSYHLFYFTTKFYAPSTGQLSKYY